MMFYVELSLGDPEYRHMYVQIVLKSELGICLHG